MKQKLGKWTLLLALFCLTGCGTAKQPSTTVNPQTTPAPAEPSPAVSTDPLLSPEIPEEADRALVVYFSATGNKMCIRDSRSTSHSGRKSYGCGRCRTP